MDLADVGTRKESWPKGSLLSDGLDKAQACLGLMH